MDSRTFSERLEQIESLALDNEALPPLRCSVCGRNLGTVFAIALHTVFPDGSLRCRADDNGEDGGNVSGKAYFTLESVVSLMESAAAYARSSHGSHG